MSKTGILNVKNVILMTLVGNLGIRWIPVAAGIGPSSLLFWLLGALLFFLPLALMVAELSCAYPEAGGIYAWTERALGKRSAFIVAWLYWVNNVFYYPAILTFLASTLAYAFGKPALANNQHFILIATIASFWLISLLSLCGIKTSKYLSIIGGIFGLILPVSALIVLGFVSLIVFQHSATAFSWQALMPNQGLLGNLSSLSILMFAMAGIEVITVFSNKVANPNRSLPLGLLSSALIIFMLYVLGTLAMNFIADPGSIAKTTGVIETFSLVDQKFHIAWFTKALALTLVLSEIAALSIWVIAPAVLFFSCVPKGCIPERLHATNDKGVPHIALLAQAILVTVILLLTSLMPSVNDMYQVLVLMATVLYFIPYLLLAITYMKIRKAGHFGQFKMPWKNYGTMILVTSTLFSVGLGILLSFVPTSDLTSNKAVVIYELELILGPVIFIAIGLYLSRKAK
jgi:amino acid transporter